MLLLLCSAAADVVRDRVQIMPKEHRHREKQPTQPLGPLQCQYLGWCSNKRAIKTNGEPHWLCKKHRDHQNALQRERYRRTMKKKKKDTPTKVAEKESTLAGFKNRVQSTESIRSTIRSSGDGQADERSRKEDHPSQSSGTAGHIGFGMADKEQSPSCQRCVDSQIGSEGHQGVPNSSATPREEEGVSENHHPQQFVCADGAASDQPYPVLFVSVQAISMGSQQASSIPGVAAPERNTTDTRPRVQDASWLTNGQQFLVPVSQLHHAVTPVQQFCNVVAASVSSSPETGAQAVIQPASSAIRGTASVPNAAVYSGPVVKNSESRR